MSSAPVEVPLLRKLDEIAGHYEQLQQSLSDPSTLGNIAQLVSITKESGQLEPVVTRYRAFLKSRTAVEELREMAANRADREMAELAATELPEARLRRRHSLKR